MGSGCTRRHAWGHKHNSMAHITGDDCVSRETDETYPSRCPDAHRLFQVCSRVSRVCTVHFVVSVWGMAGGYK